MGFLNTDRAGFEEALELCRERFGPVKAGIGPFEWEFTTYYIPEMGEGIVRHFFVFERLVDPGDLPDIKLFTNEIEKRFSADGRRKVNIDPGLLTPWNLVLATAKPRHQRVYIGKGIYGDLTMVYHTGGYKVLEWTYPDWGSDQVRQFLADVRNGVPSLPQPTVSGPAQ